MKNNIDIEDFGNETYRVIHKGVRESHIHKVTVIHGEDDYKVSDAIEVTGNGDGFLCAKRLNIVGNDCVYRLREPSVVLDLVDEDAQPWKFSIVFHKGIILLTSENIIKNEKHIKEIKF